MKTINIGPAYKKGPKNRSAPKRLPARISVEDIPLWVQSLIMSRDVSAPTHRKNNVECNKRREPLCWLSQYYIRRPVGWDQMGECNNCIDARRRGEDSLCFYFALSKDIRILKTDGESTAKQSHKTTFGRYQRFLNRR